MPAPVATGLLFRPWDAKPGTWPSVLGEAGHLAFGIGAATHAPMIVIPEMFYHTEVTFERITNLIISAIVKRKILGIDYGVAIYDDHGHPELGNVSKAHIFNILLQQKLKELGIKVKSRPVELGYELRCVQPSRSGLLWYAGLRRKEIVR